MVKRLNEAFSDEEHKTLSDHKREIGKTLGKPKISWHDYLLHISEVHKIEID